MDFAALHRYPFVRLFVGLAAGVVCGDLLFFQGKSETDFVWIILGGILFLLAIGRFLFRRYAARWLFGSLLFVGLFFLGIGVSQHALKKVHTDFPKEERVYQIRLTDHPQIKQRSIQVRAHIDSVVQNGRFRSFGADVILYFTKDKAAFCLNKGDLLWVSSSISVPADNGNPDSFDYARYLHRKGVGGTGFVRSGHWKSVGHVEDQSFSSRALSCREKVLSVYRSFGWDQDVFSVVSALTVGYKDELSADIRETYSIAGASHVLALSGLHIGFLYVLFLFLLKPLGQSRMMSFLRGTTIILLLWAFAFFTGLSPSVVRSVIMFSLFALAEALKRDNFSFNTLSAAAFFMILFSPEWLFDVGFQLSFCAVASLILFYPVLDSFVQPRTKVGKKLWQLAGVSLVAQIGTAPLVAYYFSRLSVHFLLSTLVVIPMASLIMYTAIILLVSYPIPFLSSVFADILQWMVRILNGFLRWIETLPYASVDGIWLYPVEVILLYVVSISMFSYLAVKRVRYAYCFLVGLLLFVCIHPMRRNADLPRPMIAFYNVRSCPAVHCISSDKKSWIICTDSLSDVAAHRKTLSAHFCRLHLDTPEYVYGDCQNSHLSVRSGLLTYGKIRIGIISDNRWRYQQAEHPFPLDYLYVCRGYRGKSEELLSVFHFRMVVLDSSLSPWHRNNFIEMCRVRHIPYISLQDGAFEVDI